MRLGSQTGSFNNHLMTQGPQETPEVGDGATVCQWTDRAAATVVSVSEDGRTVVVQEDSATRTDSNGMSDCQHYAYARDPRGRKWTFVKDRSGDWREAVPAGIVGGRPRMVRKGQGAGLAVGIRAKYHDYGF